jgi:hypothetical protein
MTRNPWATAGVGAGVTFHPRVYSEGGCDQVLRVLLRAGLYSTHTSPTHCHA